MLHNFMTAMSLFTVVLLMTAVSGPSWSATGTTAVASGPSWSATGATTAASGPSWSAEAEVSPGAPADARIDLSPNLDCPPPYQAIGDHCIFVDSFLFGDWSAMRDICTALNGELVNLHDANVLNAIFHYLHDNGLSDVSYWVNANDEEVEGRWVWGDNTQVHMNTPLWGDLVYRGVQEPTGGELENCAILNHQDDFYMHDVNCSDEYYVLCESTAPRSERASSSRNGSSFTDSSDPPLPFIECPSPYEKIGERCLFIVSPSNGTWWEHKRLCELLQGHMIKLNDANLLGVIYDVIVNKGLAESSVYIGASDIDQEGDWVFLDGETMPMGSPFWGNIGLDFQEPSGGAAENCASLYSYDHFFIHDVSCEDLMGVICEYN